MAGYTEAPIIGINGDSSGNDLIRLEASITFKWVPDPGNSYSFRSTAYLYDEDWNYYVDDYSESGPSKAVGSMTFEGSFRFSSGNLFSSVEWLTASWVNGSWSPADDRLDVSAYLPVGVEGGAYFLTDVASYGDWAWYYNFDMYEHGHWALAPDPHDVEAYGGAGNDTIYGGQGNQLLSGDDGDDALFLGIGTDTAFGGSGNDVIHGGTGMQILDGGAGSDTIRGGAGAQLLMGGDGRDRIEAGRGNETLLGGAGRDVFAFADGVRGRVAISDFASGQDRIEVAHGINGTAVSTLHDLALRVSDDTHGNAVLDLGNGATVTLSHISTQRVESHMQEWFKIV